MLRNSLISLIVGAAAMTPADITMHKVDTDLFAGEKFETGYAKLEGQGDMFFWLFPARNQADNAPLVMWLNGGPGCSSDFGALRENGPIHINDDSVAESNPHSWSNVAHMLYVDQPLSVGYSRADTKEAFANAKIVAANLREFLANFLEKKPEFKGRDFYISGESYAGHYIPRVGSLLLDQPIADLNFNGVAIGNGWYSAPAQYPAYYDFGVESGLVTEADREAWYPRMVKCGNALGKNQNDFLARQTCSLGRNKVFAGRNVYDYRLTENYDDAPLERFLNKPEVMNALNVLPGGWNECDDAVYKSLAHDIDVDTRGELAHIISSGKKTLVFAGDKDIICNWRGNEEVVYTLDDAEYVKPEYAFTRAQEMRAMTFSDYHGEGQLKVIDNLAFLRVFEAGHMVPMDQPESSLRFFEQFITGEIFGAAVEINADAEEIVRF